MGGGEGRGREKWGKRGVDWSSSLGSQGSFEYLFALRKCLVEEATAIPCCDSILSRYHRDVQLCSIE